MTAQWFGIATPVAEERLEEAWSSAPTETPEHCALILGVAKEQVWEYAPESFDPDSENGERKPVPTEAPERLVLAQLQQAQNLWNAGRAQQDSGVGSEGYSFVPRPLDKTVRQMIRPLQGVPYVF